MADEEVERHREAHEDYKLAHAPRVHFLRVVGAAIAAQPVGRKGGTLEELEKELIERTLAECGWNKTLAAKRMGIGRRTLYDKAARLGIPLSPENGEQ